MCAEARERCHVSSSITCHILLRQGFTETLELTGFSLRLVTQCTPVIPLSPHHLNSGETETLQPCPAVCKDAGDPNLGPYAVR